MRLPPLLAVAVRLLRMLVLGIVGVVLVGNVVVADVASTLDAGIVSEAFAFGNVVVEVHARAFACIAISTSLATLRTNQACMASEFVRAERTIMWQPLSRHTLQIGSATE